MGEGERRSDREEARTKSEWAGQYRSFHVRHHMRRAHEAHVTTGARNTHGSESASGCATLARAGGSAAAGRATKSVQATTSVGDGRTSRSRRAVAELIVQSAAPMPRCTKLCSGRPAKTR